jgi:thiamine-phosphate pyrophosphorylase
MAPPPCRLYLITPPAFDPQAFPGILAEALDAGDVACVQLRLKNASEAPSDDAVRRACDRLRPIVQERGITFILNDRPDLAAATGADGVHIGQEDGTYAEARKKVGPDAAVGVTCHDSRHLAMEAAEQGADYVAFGAFFPTATKRTKTRAEPEILENWSMTTTVPCVAIGGIKPGNCAPLVRAGADFIAVSAAVWNFADGPAAAVRAFNEAMGGAYSVAPGEREW